MNSYYSKKLKDIQDAISNSLEKIKIEKEKLKVVFPDKKNLGNSFQVDYQKALDNYNKKVKDYKIQLKILEKDLKRKSENYFNNINTTDTEIISFHDDFEAIKTAVKAHNIWLDKFDDNKKKALEKILNHYVAKYLQTEDYIKKEKKPNLKQL